MEPGEIRLSVGCGLLLEAALGVKTRYRRFAFWWDATHGLWSDGRKGGDFQYRVFSAFVHHPTVALEVRGLDLCSNEDVAAFAVLCDREERTATITPIEKALKWLETQHAGSTQAPDPHDGASQRIEPGATSWLDRLEPRTLKSLNPGDYVGEKLASQAMEAVRIGKLQAWLDTKVNPQLIEQYKGDDSNYARRILREWLERVSPRD